VGGGGGGSWWRVVKKGEQKTHFCGKKAEGVESTREKPRKRPILDKRYIVPDKRTASLFKGKEL